MKELEQLNEEISEPAIYLGREQNTFQKTFSQKYLKTWKLPFWALAVFTAIIFTFFSTLLAKNSYHVAARAFPLVDTAISSYALEAVIWAIAISVTLAIGAQPAYKMFDYASHTGEKIERKIGRKRGKEFFLDKTETILKEIREDLDNVSKHNIAIERDIVNSLARVEITSQNLLPLKEKILTNLERLNKTVENFKPANRALFSDEAVSREDKKREEKASDMLNTLSTRTLDQYRTIQAQLKNLIEENARREYGDPLLIVEKAFEQRRLKEQEERKKEEQKTMTTRTNTEIVATCSSSDPQKLIAQSLNNIFTLQKTEEKITSSEIVKFSIT